MVINKTERTHLISDVENFFIYFIVVTIAAVVLVQASGPIKTSHDGCGITNSITFKGTIKLLTVEDLSEMNKIVLRIIELADVVEFTDPNWSSVAEKLYYPIIIKHSKRYDVDPLLVKAVIMAESGFLVLMILSQEQLTISILG